MIFTTCRRRRQLALALALITLGSLPGRAAEPLNVSSNQWEFSLTPYLWLPNVSGSLTFSLPDTGPVDASTGPYNYLEHIKFLLMLQGEARKGDLSFFADTIFLRFGRENATVNVVDAVVPSTSQRSVETSFSADLIQLGAGHTVARSPHALVDAIVGIRYLAASSHLDWSLDISAAGSGSSLSPEVHTSRHQDIFDGFVGIRGRFTLGDSSAWYFPYYVDIGAGTSKFTWQAMTGVGYAMKWGDLSLTYRYLAFYGSGDQLVQHLRLNGPVAGATFRF